MLHGVKELEGFTIMASDGAIGHVREIYFDDDTWAIRWLVVETGGWLSSRKVLISPLSLAGLDWQARTLAASLTRDQVRNSPDLDSHMTVSRRLEGRFLAHYSHAPYWGGLGLWGSANYPGAMLTGVGYGATGPEYLVAQTGSAQAEAAEVCSHDDDLHLRSYQRVATYRIEANDGVIGHVQDMLFEAQNWAIRYLVVKTGRGWHGNEVLIAPSWISSVNWEDGVVALTVSQQAVREAPHYDSSASPDREYEAQLHRHHGVPGYWAEEVKTGVMALRAEAPRAGSAR